MGGSYILIAGILFYLLLLRSLESSWLSPLRAAAFWVIGYYALSSLTTGVEYVARDIPLAANLLSPVRILTALGQFAALSIVFYKAEDSDDSYISYLMWGALGLVLVFYVIPTVVQRLFMGL